ncbi:MAG TPA: FxLYD domain-containing protein [Thermoanaerobaculia bacterium]|jgi:hypothetical protein|nr:FxLYD domain-containing protein [Thermoanaerobaculia bacterium]
MKPQRFVILLGLPALLVAAGPARADWLVTREGARVETQGAWKVKGKLVVFETAAGKLSSLRVADVDLDASRRETEEAVAAEAQAAAEPDKPAERKKSVRVITDKDVREASPAAEKDQPEAVAAEPDSTAGPVLLVEAWNQARDPEKDHVLINGTLKNTAISTATGVQLKVLIFDETGTLIATSQAAIDRGAVPPGERAAFKAEFPGYFSFAKIQFDPKSRSLSTRSADQPILPAPPE